MSAAPPRPAARRTPRRSRRYRLFGITLATDLELTSPPADPADKPDLTVVCGPEPPFAPELLPPPGRIVEPAEEGVFRLVRTESHDVLRFSGLADFYVAADHVFCHLTAPRERRLIELRLLGPVLAFWLERRGLPTLHASAVAVERQAVAFLSSHHGGKTSLAAALMRAGHPLLTDDILPLEERPTTFVGHPGLPQMRMWPDAAEHFLGRYEDLETVHPEVRKRRVAVGTGDLGRFCRGPRPLGCLYLPARRPEAAGREVEIVAVPQHQAVIELVRHSFAAQVVEAMGWQERRLDFFCRLVERVPVRRLVYPGGFDRLPAVGARILDDLKALARSS